MSETSSKLKESLKKKLGELETLRDEIRLHVHLGSMDLKDEWRTLEPQVEEVKHMSDVTAQELATLANEVIRRARAMRDALKGAPPGTPSAGKPS